MNDKPRASLRRLLNETSMIIDGMHTRGFTEDEIAVVCRVYAEAQLRPRRVAPIPHDPDWDWRAWVLGPPRRGETDA